MKNTLTLALRGLLRNRRRSLVTLLAVALGVSAIILFAGYTRNVYDGLKRESIHGELLGHLTISKRGMREEGRFDPERYLFTTQDVDTLTALLGKEANVKLVAPRLALSGLISNGRVSTIFVAEAIAPEAMKALQEGLLTDREKEGGRHPPTQLDPAHPETVALSEGLVSILHLTTNGEAAVLTNTLNGQANALDVTVGHTFDTGNAGSNDKFAFFSLDLARNLLDAEGRADRLTVLLADADQTLAMRDVLQGKLATAGYDVDIETWQELSGFYTQVHGMFDMIFGFIFLIVLTVVVMSVANSMSMAVVERTREIGTLRAIGLKRRGVVLLFSVESMLLTLIGCAVGLFITLGVRWAINAADIAYVPPNSVTPVVLQVDMDGGRILLTFVLMSIVGTVAAWFPARRAARKDIIDALGHV